MGRTQGGIRVAVGRAVPFRRTRLGLGIAACAIAATGAAGAAGGLVAPTAASAGPVLAPEAVTTPPATAPPTTAAPATVAPAPAVSVPASTSLATPVGTVPTYGAPGGSQVGTVGTWYGYPLTLPVVTQQGEWLEVRLPTRPNESTAWVLSNAVTLTTTTYALVVNLTTERLSLYRAGVQVLDDPVGIGLPATPTVTGQYFVAVHEAHSEPGYGPLILDTSAHSDAIQSWDGSGDAIIAIHGPITSAADAEIGTTGARVSNGCIRMHDSDLAQLGMLPVGTPIDIVA